MTTYLFECYWCTPFNRFNQVISSGGVSTIFVFNVLFEKNFVQMFSNVKLIGTLFITEKNSIIYISTECIQFPEAQAFSTYQFFFQPKNWFRR